MQKIMDAVHGMIPLTDWQVEIIDHSLFQRLRWIGQNDVLFMVFPSARHERFSHSVGACHLAKRIWDSMTLECLRTFTGHTGYVW